MDNSITERRLLITTNGSGAATVLGEPVVGYLEAVEWVDGTLADGVDAVISMTLTPSGVDRTLVTLTNANDDAWYQVRVNEHDTTGVATGGKTRPLVRGTPKVVVAQGGDTLSGAVILHILRI
jgi:hypothetical protein